MNKLMGLILIYLIIYIQHNIYTYTYVHIYTHMYSMFFSIYHSPHWIAHTSLYAQTDPVSAYIFYIFHYALIDRLSSILCSLLSSFPLLFIHTNTHTHTQSHWNTGLLYLEATLGTDFTKTQCLHQKQKGSKVICSTVSCVWK